MWNANCDRALRSIVAIVAVVMLAASSNVSAQVVQRGAAQIDEAASSADIVQSVAYADERSRVPYEAQVLFGSFSCSGGWCKAKFLKVAANRRFEVKSMACAFTTNGKFIDAQAEYQNASGTTMYLPLASEWQRANGSNTNATFGKQTNLFVPAGRTLLAVVHITGSLIGAHCQAFGDMVTLK
jgi:hypothetical protein